MENIYKELSLEEKADYGSALLDELTGLLLEIKNKPILLYTLLDSIFQKLHYAKELGLNISKYTEQIQHFQETIITSDINRKIKKIPDIKHICEFNSSLIKHAYETLINHGLLTKDLEYIYIEFRNKIENAKIIFQIKQISSSGSLGTHDCETLQELMELALDKDILTDEMKSELLN